MGLAALRYRTRKLEIYKVGNKGISLVLYDGQDSQAFTGYFSLFGRYHIMALATDGSFSYAGVI